MKVRCSRRIISGLLLLWLGLLQFPLPFAVRAVGSASNGKDLSTPFPCMNRPCGCRSAEECWTNCCCTTKAERIAFVLEHDLEMPAALTGGGEDHPKRTCCSTKPAACCDTAVCDAQDCPTAKCATKPRGKKLVLFDSVMKCKGLSSLLLQFAGAALPVADWKPLAVRVREAHDLLADEFAAGVFLAPPAPPPRIAG